ncbi:MULTISPECIES: extracellular solute-binding protein [Asticcacaulis]|uniref:extracellular solute-binding protein n=1 Tax=Asticcacaulis TaxID=76890 RepID=UPI001AE1D7D3|nr:extracellular solute-binding protein [Asticcacaulis sp. BE141]MBP2161497.1 multiple sugar transport system substrate-binding protein [Asticcacaulis solisilvae]MDR6802542.1 multiple sugar transport system substrate-binding protein [Asticcacaulis sp. BE141]
MRAWAALLCALVALGGCEKPDPRPSITVQRIFGDCRAHVPKFGKATLNPNGECEIITELLDRFEAENPDIRLNINTVAWPGYNQLSAQLAADDAPDLVTMHMAVIPDYQTHGLLMPMGQGLAKAGVAPDAFTPAARRAVTINNEVYGLPFDTWTQLFHINMNLFGQAGLVRNGEPILPRNAQELLTQARQFHKATGKPYFVQSIVNEKAAYARNLYTYLLAQNEIVFPEPNRIRVNTSKAREIVALFRQIYAEDLTTRDQDYAAATTAFINGEGGVYIVGTWMIGTFDTEAALAGRPLYHGYRVKPYPRLFGQVDPAFVDGHAWVMPRKKRTPAQEAATYRLLKFLSQHEAEWTRSGHLSSMQAVADDPKWRAGPHRRDLVAITNYGQGLPTDVQRQFAIQEMLSDELAAAITGLKPIDEALGDAETRINDMLANLS